MTTLPAGCDEASACLRRAGLDLLTPFDASLYNRLVQDHGYLKPLETFGHRHPLAWLIGNTRALWPVLRQAVAARPDLLARDPVDRYVTSCLAECADALQVSAQVYPSHEGGAGLVSMLHAAEASGMAHRGPAHLAVHPSHGLWFALRAVIVLDWPYEGVTTSAPDPCTDCAEPCVAALEAAMARQHDVPRTPGSGAGWRDWVRIREVCPVGQAARYCDDQIRYHYTLDLDSLRPR